jgi:hypothetical protein
MRHTMIRVRGTAGRRTSGRGARPIACEPWRERGAGLIGVHSVERLQSVLEEACGRVIPFDVFSLAIYDARRTRCRS